MTNNITLEALAMINQAWNQDKMITIFFQNGDPHEVLSVKDAVKRYGKETVNSVIRNTVELVIE